MDNPPLIQVKVAAPFHTYFEGQATSVSAANDTGPFDVLSQHKNFMSILKPGPITVRLPNRPAFTMNIEQGIMHVKADKVSVFLDV